MKTAISLGIYLALSCAPQLAYAQSDAFRTAIIAQLQPLEDPEQTAFITNVIAKSGRLKLDAFSALISKCFSPSNCEAELNEYKLKFADQVEAVILDAVASANRQLMPGDSRFISKEPLEAMRVSQIFVSRVQPAIRSRYSSL
jgi:hypothetical protein